MTTTVSSINLDYLRLMAGDDEAMIQTILPMLMEELPEELGQLKALYAAEDWQELSRISHKMKSTLSFIGNKAMQDANHEIERLAKSRADFQKIGELLALMDEHFPPVMRDMEKARQKA